jgi:hypothetical protein
MGGSVISVIPGGLDQQFELRPLMILLGPKSLPTVGPGL